LVAVEEYAGHAREIVKSLNLDDWYGILIISGDGLIFEVRSHSVSVLVLFCNDNYPQRIWVCFLDGLWFGSSGKI